MDKTKVTPHTSRSKEKKIEYKSLCCGAPIKFYYASDFDAGCLMCEKCGKAISHGDQIKLKEQIKTRPHKHYFVEHICDCEFCTITKMCICDAVKKSKSL